MVNLEGFRLLTKIAAIYFYTLSISARYHHVFYRRADGRLCISLHSVWQSEPWSADWYENSISILAGKQAIRLILIISGMTFPDRSQEVDLGVVPRYDAALMSIQVEAIANNAVFTVMGATISKQAYDHFTYPRMSPGWQSNASHIFSSVSIFIAFAFPFFRIDMFAMVIPTRSDNSVTLIFLLASITSIDMIIGIFPSHGQFDFLFHIRYLAGQMRQQKRSYWYGQAESDHPERKYYHGYMVHSDDIQIYRVYKAIYRIGHGAYPDGCQQPWVVFAEGPVICYVYAYPAERIQCCAERYGAQAYGYDAWRHKIGKFRVFDSEWCYYIRHHQYIEYDPEQYDKYFDPYKAGCQHFSFHLGWRSFVILY
jgi:hypothetical protein